MVDQVNIGIIGTGWCGGIRANACAANALVGELHIADIDAARLAEVAAEAGPASATADYRELLANLDIAAILISATPEATHYPIAKDCLEAGKHVFVEKPIAETPEQADELIALAAAKGLKFTVGYSQRWNPKLAYMHQAIRERLIGDPVTIMMSRHLSRSLGTKISGRTKLSPAAMEATHDIDFVLWCLEPRRPVRVYAQNAYGVYKDVNGAADHVWVTITMDDGVTCNIGGGWILPPGHPNYCMLNVEVLGTEGTLFIDDSGKDVMVNTMEHGVRFPTSTMPGVQVDHVYVGPMADETIHFVEAVAYDRAPLVTPAQARLAMDCYIAADVSAERNEPVPLPQNAPPTLAATG